MSVGGDIGGRKREFWPHHPLTPTAATHCYAPASDADVRARRQSQPRRAAVAAEMAGDDKERATDPRHAPGGERRGDGYDVATQEIVGQQFEEERGVIGGEVGRRDLADAPGALEVGDERLDAGQAGTSIRRG